ncbi:hypothetical protein CCY01nite_40200 [Chitinophaga cymbidii]|uniref:Uncharacterized protein n=2 Tax=Chitinophaga cymbidii TaxID=1096750 RepID=A0A512RPZ5_9BACT|nr:hypothetical protein CCY01nite_40200 [Chitinophaga cymbidii]
MQYPIDQLDRLLTETIHPAQFVTQPLMEGQIANYIATVRTAQADIRQFLWRKASKAKDLIAMERLVSLYQASIIRLLDTLYQYQLDVTSNKVILECYQGIYHELEALLGYIERYFPHFINCQQKVPDGFLSVSIQQLKSRAGVTKEKLRVAGVHPVLTRIALACIQLPENVTYAHLLYCKMLLTLLDDPQLFDGATDVNQRVAEKLIYLNYNHDRFVLEIIRYIYEDVNNIQDHAQKVERLLFHQKGIHQIFLRPGVAWELQLPHISHQVDNWIKWELRFLQERGQLQPLPVSLPSSQPFIQTNLEGAHIYTLVMLFVDSGLVLNYQYGSLAELVAPIMATRHKKGFSPESLKKYKDKITPAIRTMFDDC